jgi:hypothetical protein
MASWARLTQTEGHWKPSPDNQKVRDGVTVGFRIRSRVRVGVRVGEEKEGVCISRQDRIR